MLLPQRHWVFDLDGTLTIAMHDFDAIRAELGLPPQRPILESIAALPAGEQPLMLERLDAIEAELVDHACPAPGAAELLAVLSSTGYRRGILTRNSAANAWGTLEATGLARYFDPTDVVGRDDAAPKPDPGGVLLLSRRWGAAPEETVVVGDYLFDLLAARAAGAHAVYVDGSGAFPWREHADTLVGGLVQLSQLVAAP